MNRPVRSKRLPYVVVAVLVVIGLALALVALRLSGYRREATRLSNRLDGELRALEQAAPARRWSPKPLRGASHEGNGAELQFALAGRFTIPEGLFSTEATVGCPSAEQRTFLDAHRAELDELRHIATVQSAQTRLDLQAGHEVPLPAYGPVLRAHRALRARAQLEPARGCFEQAADSVRLAQQLVPGGSVIGAVFSARSLGEGAELAARCIGGATPAELNDAASELSRLGDDAPSLANGDGIEQEYLARAATMRKSLQIEALIPFSADERESVTQGGLVLEAWRWSLDQLPEARAIGEAGYPMAADRWRALSQAERASSNSLIALSSAVEAAMGADRTAQAKLRVVAALLHQLAVDAKAGSPQALAGASFPDPFRLASISLARDGDGKLRAWSVGPDTADQSGQGDDISLTGAAAGDRCR